MRKDCHKWSISFICILRQITHSNSDFFFFVRLFISKKNLKKQLRRKSHKIEFSLKVNLLIFIYSVEIKDSKIHFSWSLFLSDVVLLSQTPRKHIYSHSQQYLFTFNGLMLTSLSFFTMHQWISSSCVYFIVRHYESALLLLFVQYFLANKFGCFTSASARQWFTRGV